MHDHHGTHQRYAPRTHRVIGVYSRLSTFGNGDSLVSRSGSRKSPDCGVSEISETGAITFTPLVNVAYYDTDRQTRLSCLPTHLAGRFGSIGPSSSIERGTRARTATRRGIGRTLTAGAHSVPTPRNRVLTRSNRSSTRCTTRSETNPSRTTGSSSRTDPRDSPLAADPDAPLPTKELARPAACGSRIQTMPGRRSVPAPYVTMFTNTDHIENADASTETETGYLEAVLERTPQRKRVFFSGVAR